MKRRRGAAAVLVSAALVAGLIGCGGDDGGGPTGPVLPDDLPPWGGLRTLNHAVTVDGRTRTAVIHLPAGYVHDASLRLPLLLAFHGSGGSALQMREQTGFDLIAEDAGFIVAYLDADGFWVTPCEGCDNDGRAPDEDIRFARDLVWSLAESYAVDPYDVTATGFSMGGFFLHYLGCHPDSPVRGIAPVAANARETLPADCPLRSGRAPVDVLITNGLVDLVVPPEGTETTLSIDEGAEFWRDWSRCSAVTVEEAEPAEPVGDAPRILRTTWRDCGAGTRVAVQKVERAGHLWLRESTNAAGVDYGRTIARFFGLGLPTTMAAARP
jgi:polyhydroxybutyrate depolymerase